MKIYNDNRVTMEYPRRWKLKEIVSTIGNCKNIEELMTKLGIDKMHQNDLFGYLTTMGMLNDFKQEKQ